MEKQNISDGKSLAQVCVEEEGGGGENEAGMLKKPKNTG